MTSQPTADEVTRNMQAGIWIERWRPTDGRSRHPLAEPDVAAKLSPEELVEATETLNRNGPDTEAGAQAATRLTSHAAWYVREHFPDARYPRHAGDGTMPTLSAIAALAAEWPATIRKGMPAKRANPVKGTSLSSRAARRTPMPDDVRLALYGVRAEAASRFAREHRDTGQLPQSPSIIGMDTAEQMAEREGWFDHAATVRDDATDLARDPADGPVAPEWAAGADPVAKASERVAREEIRRVQRKSADALDEAAGQRAADEAFNATGQPAGRSRQAVELAAAKAGDKTEQHGWGPHAEDVDTARSVGDLIGQTAYLMLRLGRTVNLADASDIEKKMSALVRATERMQVQRTLRSHHGTGPKSETRDRQAMTAYRKAARNVAEMIEQRSADPRPPIAAAWSRAREMVTQAGAAAEAYTLPQRASMRESDEYDRVSKMSVAELREAALMVRVERRGHQVVETLLVPERWVVDVDRDPVDSSLRIWITEDIDTVAGSLQQMAEELKAHLRDNEASLDEIRTGKAAWIDELPATQALTKICEAINHRIETGSPWGAETDGPLRAAALQLRERAVQDALTDSALRRATRAAAEVVRLMETAQWTKSRSAVAELIATSVTKGRSKQHRDRMTTTDALRDALRRLDQTLLRRVDEEMRRAQSDPAVRLRLPDDKAEQMVLMG